MSKQIKIAYCIPSLYYPSGMERVLTLKANYFAEHFGYEIHIILTDGKNKKPYYELHPSITLHQLDINYDEMYGRTLPKRILGYSKRDLMNASATSVRILQSPSSAVILISSIK